MPRLKRKPPASRLKRKPSTHMRASKPSTPRSARKHVRIPAESFVLACLCLALLVPAFARVSAQDGAPTQRADPAVSPTPPANSVIRGRAVFDETNRPVRRASVHLLVSGTFGAQQRVVLTDVNGQFRIEGVGAGSYFIFVESPGVLTPISFAQYGGFTDYLDNLFKYFTQVDVDGKGEKEVEVRAHLGGAIGGRVVYSDGTPAPGVHVSVIPRSDARDAPTPMHMSRTPVPTDERGRYRISGLPPGEYLVAASELIAHSPQLAATVITSTLVQTYHPSEMKAAKAEAVSISVGDEREDVDITIADRETHSIAGVVRGRHDGLPVAGAMVAFAGKENAGEMTNYLPYAYVNTTRTDAEGHWRFNEMPDGEYTINVTPPEERTEEDEDEGEDEDEQQQQPTRPKPKPTPPKKNYAPGRLSVSVAGSDVSDLVVTLGQAARIAGTMSVEGGRPLPEYRFIYARPVGKSQTEMIAADTGDAGFKFEGLAPGKYVLEVYTDLPGVLAAVPASETSDLYVKAVTWRGLDLMRAPLELREGESVEGVSIVFAPGRASLRLRAYAAGPEKSPARGLYVILMPTDRAQRYKSDLPRCLTDKDGACLLGGPPGEYALLYSRVVRDLDPSDEAALERRIANAPRITLRPGGPDAFELTVAGGN